VNVQLLAVRSLSGPEREETGAFGRHVLGPVEGRVPAFALRADRYTWAGPEWSVMVKAKGRVVSHAGIQLRVVRVGEQRVLVGGIGGIMTLPAWRGRGFARAALRKAVAFLDHWLGVPFALVICPAEAAAFLRRLGWQLVDAPIVCDQAGRQVALSGEVALVLPGQAGAWPPGPIDLCGPPW
jgi:GNAT superfamily N-acetyltransferase